MNSLSAQEYFLLLKHQLKVTKLSFTKVGLTPGQLNPGLSAAKGSSQALVSTHICLGADVKEQLQGTYTAENY